MGFLTDLIGVAASAIDPSDSINHNLDVMSLNNRSREMEERFREDNDHYQQLNQIRRDSDTLWRRL